MSDRRGYRFREAVGVIGEGVGLGKWLVDAGRRLSDRRRYRFGEVVSRCWLEVE